jgi:hypothetical protein
VERRSSRYSTGTLIKRDNSVIKALVFSACKPRLPSMFMGRPASTSLTSLSRIISTIFPIVAASSARSTIVNGVARIPRGSLRARPMRLSPTSSARMRVMSTSHYTSFFTRLRASSSLVLSLPPAWAKSALPPPPPPVTCEIFLTISPA